MVSAGVVAFLYDSGWPTLSASESVLAAILTVVSILMLNTLFNSVARDYTRGAANAILRPRAALTII